jgi:macrolide transport system ATP-binding/permease protein
MLDDVSRRYHGETPTDALRGVSLTIQQGEFVAIEGPSGGGKSTLLNIVGLLDAPTLGRYYIGEADVAAASPRTLAELRSDKFAFIFQSFHLLDRRPVIDSVELGLLYRAVPAAERRETALRALDEVGLARLADQVAGKLSGGERQRVAIARALASGAPVIVADEPTGNLDSDNSAAIVDSLRILHNSGSTIVLVTHSPDIAAVAERRIRMRDGRILDDSGGSIRSSEGRQLESSTSPPGRASRLRPRDLLKDAVASLTSRLSRTAGLVAAVAVGVALAVGTLGISVSASAQVAETFDSHVNRDVTLAWQPDSLSAQTEAQLATLSSRLEEISGVEAAGTLDGYGQRVVSAGPERPSFTIDGYTMSAAIPAAARLSIRWPADAHDLAHGEVLVGGSLAEQLELGPLADGPIISVDGALVTVAGIIETSPRVAELLGGVLFGEGDPAIDGEPTRAQALVLTVAGAAQQAAEQARLVVNPYEPASVTVDAPIDPSTLRTQIESDLGTTLLVLTVLAVLASVAGLANAMVLSVLERKQEFGLRRALGARPVHIVELVLAESTLIGAMGGVIGLLLGLAGILAVTIARQWSPVFDLSLAPIAIAGGIVVGAAGGIVASSKASRIQPNEALRV